MPDRPIKLVKKKTTIAPPPWQRFRVGTPSQRPNWDEDDCLTFTEVSHVAHLEAAHRIVTDGKIRSGLVSDESKLNQERIQVSWLSPNHWGPGYRYGSIRFAFDLPSLIEDHRFYWVESIAYGVEACRILITKNDYSGHHVLIPYDPTAGDGPWWFNEKNGIHYRNGLYCLEFMVEHDLELSDLEDLSFEKHHQHQCCIDSRVCPERGMESMEAAARFLSRLVATGSKIPAPIRGMENSGCTRHMESALWRIQREIVKRSNGLFSGTITLADPNSLPIARAILNAYAYPALRADIPALAQLFRSQDDLIECTSYLIEDLLRPNVAPSPPLS